MFKKLVGKIFRYGVPVVVIVLMMAWLAKVFRSDRIEPGKVPVAERSAAGVEGVLVEASSEPEIWEAVGSVYPDSKSVISAKIVALIMKLPVRAGQHVSKGELLARLDDRDIRKALAQVRQSLRRAEVTLEIAQRDFDRDQSLAEKKVIPPVEFDHTRLRRDTAAADVARLQQAVREAEVRLSYARILSPYDGVVIDTESEIGDLAAPGKPILTMYQSNRLLFQATVPERYRDYVRQNRRYTLRVEAAPAPMAGVVKEIIPSADPASRTSLARVTMPRQKGMVPGMFGRLEIPIGKQERILIPENAVIRVGQLTMVDVIEHDLLRRRSVQLGRRMGDRVEVLSGLVAGERIAAAPQGGGGE